MKQADGALLLLNNSAGSFSVTQEAHHGVGLQR